MRFAENRAALFSAVLCAALTACSPYDPAPFQQPDASASSSSGELEAGRLFAINPGRQICNPSVSQDEESFPASLLWLGFSGELAVGDAPEGFVKTGARQHDRLVISDTANAVSWYMMLQEIPAITCEFQDPEWSTHPKVLATLGAWSPVDNCDEQMVHGGFAIRPEDRQSLLWNDSLNGTATPHLWVDPQVTLPSDTTSAPAPAYDSRGWADTASVHRFFGTLAVKMAYSAAGSSLTLHFRDYASGGEVTLPKPAGQESWNAESGLISPDGKWIAYNLYERPTYYESWVQELRAGAVPHLVATGAADPHWWVHPQDPSRLFLIYVQRPADASYIVTADLSLPAVEQSASEGSTWRQELRLTAGAPTDIAFEKIGEPVLLANLPMKGGRSPDGRTLGTGTNYGYLFRLE